MRAVIVSDVGPATTAVRELLLREGYECPASYMFSVDAAVDQLTQVPADLIVIALAPDTEKSLRVLGQVNSFSKASILAVGPTGDARLVLRTLRTGAADFIGEEELAQDLSAALERLKNGQALSEAPARTIAILSPSGGSGSSTLAANIAAALAKEHKSALLVDLKLQSGDLAALLDLKPTHTIAELCQHVALMDRVMLERSLVKHTSGVSLLAPPRNFADIGYVTAEGVRQVLAVARNLFPYVVMDLDHSFRDEQLQALRQADIVILLLRLEFACLRNMRRTLDYLRGLGLTSERVRVVVNRYGQAQEVPAAKAEEALGVKIFHYVPDDPKTVNRANNNGTPLVLESPWAKVSKSLSKLASSVNGRAH